MELDCKRGVRGIFLAIIRLLCSAVGLSKINMDTFQKGTIFKCLTDKWKEAPGNSFSLKKCLSVSGVFKEFFSYH